MLYRVDSNKTKDQRGFIEEMEKLLASTSQESGEASKQYAPEIAALMTALLVVEESMGSLGLLLAGTDAMVAAFQIGFMAAEEKAKAEASLEGVNIPLDDNAPIAREIGG